MYLKVHDIDRDFTFQREVVFCCLLFLLVIWRGILNSYFLVRFETDSQGFIEEKDLTSVPEGTVVNNGGIQARELLKGVTNCDPIDRKQAPVLI